MSSGGLTKSHRSGIVDDRPSRATPATSRQNHRPHTLGDSPARGTRSSGGFLDSRFELLEGTPPPPRPSLQPREIARIPNASLPKMRALPFKRTAKRSIDQPQKPLHAADTNGQGHDDDDGLSLFQRSANFFEEDEKRRAEDEARKAEKKRRDKDASKPSFVGSEFHVQSDEDESKADHDRPLSSKLPATPRKTEPTKREIKRRRSSLEEANGETNVSCKSSRKSSTASPTLRRPSASAVSAGGPSPRSSRVTRAVKATVEVITLNDSDEEDSRPAPKASLRSNRMSSKVKASLQEEMWAEDLPRGESDRGRSPSEPPHAASDPMMDELTAPYVEAARARQLLKNNAALKDEKAEILIDSPLEGTVALIAKIKFPQQLGIVRAAWLDKQYKANHMSEEQGRNCFLTWKGMKVTDYTSLLGLGIKPDATTGRLHSDFKEDKEGYYSWNRVHFEAWTPELWEEYEREREKARQAEWDPEVISDDDDPPQDASSPVQRSPSVPRIKLTFKARDAQPHEFTGFPSTILRNLVLAYRHRANVAANKRIELMWDGEVLEPSSTLGDADLEDGDQIEVHIR